MALAAIACSGAFAASAHAGNAFTDNDEGPSGPLQSKFENSIVFAHSYIERTDADPKKLITATTLSEPIYLRFFRSKTPASILHTQGHDDCFGTQRFDKTYAYVEGHEKDSVLLNEAGFGNETFMSSRSSTINVEDKKLSLLPTEHVDIALAPQEHKAFIAVIAQMKPGKNKVIFEEYLGCQSIVQGDKPVIQGTLTFDVKAGDIAAFLKRTGPYVSTANQDRASQAIIEPRFRKAMVKGSKVITFVAEKTEVEPEESKTTPLRALLRNAEGTCSYIEGWWKQKYIGGGRFDEGGYEAGETNGFGGQISVPCP